MTKLSPSGTLPDSDDDRLNREIIETCSKLDMYLPDDWNMNTAAGKEMLLAALSTAAQAKARAKIEEALAANDND
ncbi:MAG: hypothetical protein K8T25_06685 [Planctomycetia bacterium]|nr:hypothetical protein [Planctomycetia bacterium]